MKKLLTVWLVVVLALMVALFPASEALAALESFVGMVSAGDCVNALPAFVGVANSVAVLLFGEDANDAGFMEYVFRIDPRLGIFYWYVERLRGQSQVDPDLALIELYIGIYSLASF